MVRVEHMLGTFDCVESVSYVDSWSSAWGPASDANLEVGVEAVRRKLRRTGYQYWWMHSVVL